MTSLNEEKCAKSLFQISRSNNDFYNFYNLHNRERIINSESTDLNRPIISFDERVAFEDDFRITWVLSSWGDGEYFMGNVVHLRRSKLI